MLHLMGVSFAMSLFCPLVIDRPSWYVLMKFQALGRNMLVCHPAWRGHVVLIFFVIDLIRG